MDGLLSLAITFALSQVVLSTLLLLRSKAPTIRHNLYAILLVAITAFWGSYKLWRLTRVESPLIDTTTSGDATTGSSRFVMVRA